jgi:multiple sugar transport system substrate-binding protein
MIVRRAPRRLAGALLALVTAVGLAACGSGSGDSNGKTEITFWDNNGGPARTPLYQQLITQFEAANPDITVKYVGIPSSSVQQKYDTAVAGGGTPDVGGVTTSYLSGLVGQDALEPLDDRLSGSATLDNKIVPGFLDTVKATAPDKKLYELPSSGNLDVIWYRTDLFQKAGLKPPTTWDEFFTDAVKLTDPAKQQYGYTLRGGAGSIFQLFTEMYAYSGESAFFDASGKSTVDTPKNVELVRRMAELYKKATPTADVNNNFTQMVAEFTGGNVAMMHHNLGSTGDVTKALGDKVAAVPLPNTGGATTVVPNPVDGFAVFKKSKHKDAAWKFAEFLVSKASNSYWNQKVGQIPANTDVSGEAWLAADKPVQNALTLLNDSKTVQANAPTYLPQYSAITKADSEPLYQKVLLGQMSPQDFLSQLAGKLTTAQQQWDKRHK